MNREIDWTFEDVDGINPTGVPMDLSFELSYTFTPGCPARIRYDENDHPEEPPEIEIYEANLQLVNGIPVEHYTKIQNNLSKWFLNKINSDKDLRNVIYDTIYEKLDDIYEGDYENN